MLLGAEKESAAELADDFRIVWETNEMLLQDFPEIAYPIHELKGVTQRAKAQLLNDEPTHMRWSGTKIVLPTVDGSAASGSVLRATGLLGRVRGMKSTTSSGETIRPDLVLVEDFQTDASAHSDLQCHKREKTIAQAVLGLAGPGQKIAAFATCTVIRKGDAADRILNQDIYPRWRGVRCKLVEQWPDESLREPKANEDPNLWQQYQTIRQDELAEGNESHPRATAFYRKHQVTMDAGASIRWPARKFAHEHSGIEHAINLRADNPDSFDAEYQNDPPGEDDATNSRFLDSDGFCMAIGPQLHRIVPDDTLAVTVGIDVHPSALYFATVAIREGFGGQVIDYGTWPEQPAGEYFTHASIPRSIQRATGKDGAAATFEALDSLRRHLFGNRYLTEAGIPYQPDFGLVDAGDQTDTIYDWTRRTDAPLMACLGIGVTAKQVPWLHHRRKRGERTGFAWKQPPIARTGSARRINIDTNTWKTDIQQRFALAEGSRGRLTLYRDSAINHRQFADHMAAEFSTETTGQGRTLLEWSPRPGKDNHWLDCVTYAIVAANVNGIVHPLQHRKRTRRHSTSATTQQSQPSQVERQQLQAPGLAMAKPKVSLAERRAKRRNQ
ncbi:MAG: terminase gpA endonuclease subunit [Planctomycetota bacterium]